MKIFSLFGFGIFWALAFTDAILIFNNQESYRVFTRPFLAIIILLTIFATISRRKNSFFKTLLIAALLFAALGDILLLNAVPASSHFKMGIASFMVTHVLFTIYFFRVYPFSIQRPAGAFFTILLMGGMSLWLVYFIKPYLLDLLIPIAMFSLVISVMISAAVNMVHSATMRNTALETFIPGALLFVLSYFMLAINTFYFEEQVINTAVMLTYCGALYYLSKGFIKHLHKRSRKKPKPEVAL